MRLDALSTRTRLLAVLAGVAIVGYLLALAGLGGRIAPPDLEATAPVLPVLPEPTPERLTSLDDYAGIAGRSLFSSDRSPKAFQLVPDTQANQAEDVRLTGVLITPTVQMATLQTSGGASLRLQLDAAATDGWRLLSVEPRAAVVEGPGGVRSLQLQTFGGDQAGMVIGPAAAPHPGASTQVPTDGHGLAVATRNTGAASARPSAPAADPGAAATTQDRIEAIRRRIEERRQQLLQQGQASAPASNP